MELNNQCYCCLLRPSVKDLKTPYMRLGITEIYSDMLKECFEISLLVHDEDGTGICEVCVGRLQDASDFKLQVQRSQAELRARLERTWQAIDEVKIEVMRATPSPDAEKKWIVPIDIKSDMEFQVKKEDTELPISCSPGEDFQTFDSDPSTMMQMDGYVKDEDHWKMDIKGVSFETDTESHRYDKVPKPAYKNLSKQYKLSHTTRKTYDCELCRESFTSKYYRNKHRLEHKGETPTFNCEICHESFTSVYYRNKHKLEHAMEINYTCKICNISFQNNQLLLIHKANHKNEESYICAMRKRKIAQRHDEKFCCEICGRWSASLALLKLHKRRHAGDKAYTCDMCKKGFVDKCDLVCHIRIHMNIKPFSCRFCARGFAKSSQCKRHEQVHQEDRPTYPCDICFKPFRYKHHLKTHKLVHTGERPHSCDICGKTFRVQYNFKTHLKTHEEGKSHSCDICLKSYSTKESLRQHRRVHSTKKEAKSNVYPGSVGEPGYTKEDCQ